MVYDIRMITAQIVQILDAHRRDAPGHYGRTTNSPLSPTGAAAATQILFTLGQLPDAPATRTAWIATLQAFQDPADGLFREEPDLPIVVTARCVAALELFDARPAHPLHGLNHLAEPVALTEYLNGLPWATEPAAAARQAAALYAARVVPGAATAEWEDAYFAWLWSEQDSFTGLWRRGYIGADRLAHVAGAAVLVNTAEYARRRLQFPTPLLHTCEELWRTGPAQRLWKNQPGAEWDWAYCQSRALSRAGDRFRQGRLALSQFADEFHYFLRRERLAGPDWNDLWRVSRAVACLAELQAALPGGFRTERPLRLAADRCPLL